MALQEKIVNLLEASQYFEPIAMIRKESQKEQFEKRNIKTVMADLEKDVSHAVKNIDKILFAAGSGGEKVEAVDENGAKKLIDAGKKANIKKFVMLSSMGADKPEKADELKEYLKAKHDADVYLRESGLVYSIIRPGALTDKNGKGHIKLAEKLNESGEISRDDVAQVLVSALHDNALINETVEIIEGETMISIAIPN